MTASEFIRKKMLLSNGEEYRTGNNLNKAKVEEMAGMFEDTELFDASLDEEILIKQIMKWLKE